MFHTKLLLHQSSVHLFPEQEPFFHVHSKETPCPDKAPMLCLTHLCKSPYDVEHKCIA